MPRKTKTVDPQMELVPIDDLKPNPRNPKRHAPSTIGDSINRFGMMEPVILDQRTGYLIAGHGRRDSILAMRDDGRPAPDGVLVDDDGNWLVPTVTSWRSKNDAEADAAIIALNRTTEIGGWDDVELFEMLNELEAGDLLAGVGYGGNEIDLLRRIAEADEQMTMDLSDVIDEFLDETGTGSESFRQVAFRTLKVTFYDEDGARMFFDKLGIKYDPDIKLLGYPNGVQRSRLEDFNAG
jgi:hypothetical protein